MINEEDEEDYFPAEDTDFEEEIEDLDDESNLEEEPVDEEVHTLDWAKKAKKKNMYFDEERVKDLIINDYQPYLDYEVNEEGKRVCISRERVDPEIEKEIMANLLLIANAIINKYSFWRFDALDELQAECLKAMWVYLPNYVPGKGTAFNLFSILCKRHLLNFTLKEKKNRLTADIDICPDAENKEPVNYELFFEDLEETFLETINKHYLREERKRYIELTSILMEYLDKNKKIVGKNDLYSFCKEYGYKSSEFKKFINEMSKYKSDFFELIGK